VPTSGSPLAHVLSTKNRGGCSWCPQVARRWHTFLPQRTEVAALGAHRWVAAGRLAAVVTSQAASKATTDRQTPLTASRWARR
jgi:hypothetical protein